MGQNNQIFQKYICAYLFTSQGGEKWHEGINTLETL